MKAKHHPTPGEVRLIKLSKKNIDLRFIEWFIGFVDAQQIVSLETGSWVLTSTSSHARPCTLPSSSIVMILPVVTVAILAHEFT